MALYGQNLFKFEGEEVNGVIPSTFDYHLASTLGEAFSLSKEYGDEAKYMSGGHSLLPMMKLRFATPRHVIDISQIASLEKVLNAIF